MVNAQETNFEGVLEGKKQYQIPLYQRVYAWGKRQRDQLWDDIVELAHTRRDEPTATHFIGSLVLAASPDIGAVGVQKYLVVDGQQRLITLTILLAALRDHLAATVGADHRGRLDNQYLVNPYEAGQPTKLLPTLADRAPYLEVIRGGARAGGSDAVGTAYRHFLSKIALVDDPDDPDDLTEIEHAVLRGLSVVAITAQPGDNAHRIFESLNNTGLKLSQSDLLKNYLFMRLGERAELVYDAVWLPLEQKLSADNLELLFWLDLVQRDERAKQTDTYLGQQKRLDRLISVREIEAEIHRVAGLGEVLAAILDPQREPDHEVRRRLDRIRSWGSTTSYPIVMHVLARRASGEATNEQVVRALTYLESYFVRRVVIGRATANLNRTLLQAVGAIAEEPEVDVALRAYLSRGRKYYATDQQVRQAAETVAFYWQGRGPQKKLILQWLEESYGSKEIVSSTNLTIEHVLPQTLRDAARAEFAATLRDDADISYEHERLVHTLGNLTLTGYNSELSNRPFAEKREQLVLSGLRMNQDIAANDCWAAREIGARGTELADRIISIWPGPDESLAEPIVEPSAMTATVASIVAEIPAGRWTSYGELALVTGTYPQPLAAIIGRFPVPNGWRVLQTGGTISPGFRWLDGRRDEDPREVLAAEGITFDDSGRAAPAQFVAAQELAELAGFDIDPDRTTWTDAMGSNSITSKQQEFFERLRTHGQSHAAHIKRWQTPRPQHWYEITIGTSQAHVALTVNSIQHQLAVELYLHEGAKDFPRLFAQRANIEKDLGLKLDWRELPSNKSSRIVITRDGDFTASDEEAELVEWMVGTADAFVSVFPRYL